MWIVAANPARITGFYLISPKQTLAVSWRENFVSHSSRWRMAISPLPHKNTQQSIQIIRRAQMSSAGYFFLATDYPTSFHNTLQSVGHNDVSGGASVCSLFPHPSSGFNISDDKLISFFVSRVCPQNYWLPAPFSNSLFNLCKIDESNYRIKSRELEAFAQQQVFSRYPSDSSRNDPTVSTNFTTSPFVACIFDSTLM